VLWAQGQPGRVYCQGLLTAEVAEGQSKHHGSAASACSAVKSSWAVAASKRTP